MNANLSLIFIATAFAIAITGYSTTYQGKGINQDTFLLLYFLFSGVRYIQGDIQLAKLEENIKKTRNIETAHQAVIFFLVLIYFFFYCLSAISITNSESFYTIYALTLVANSVLISTIIASYTKPTPHEVFIVNTYKSWRIISIIEALLCILVTITSLNPNILGENNIQYIYNIPFVLLFLVGLIDIINNKELLFGDVDLIKYSRYGTYIPVKEFFSQHLYKRDRAVLYDVDEKESLCMIDKIKNKKSVLDIGCGDLRYSDFILNVDKYTGLDQATLSKHGENILNKNKKIEFIHGDFIKFNTKEKYDLILLNFVLSCSSHSDVKLLIKKASQFLEKNGVLLISDVHSRYARKPDDHLIISDNGDEYTKVSYHTIDYISDQAIINKMELKYSSVQEHNGRPLIFRLLFSKNYRV